MFKTILTLSLATGLLVSCSKKDEKQNPAEASKNAEAAKNPEAPKDTEATHVPAVAVQPTAAVLVFKAATLGLEKGTDTPDGDESIELDDEGNVIIKGKTVLTLVADGSIKDKAGKVIGKIAADGKLTLEGSDKIIIVSEDSTVTVNGKTSSTIDDDGVLSMPGINEKIVFEGPKEARRAMMVAFMAAMMVSGENNGSTASVTAPAKGERTDLKAGDEGCNLTFEGRCFKTDVDACKAGGCELTNCIIAESMPGQVSCPKPS